MVELSNSVVKFSYNDKPYIISFDTIKEVSYSMDNLILNISTEVENFKICYINENMLTHHFNVINNRISND